MPKAKNRAPQTKAKNKYNANNYERVYLIVKKGMKDIIKRHAENKNLSVNKYIENIVFEQLRAEGEDLDNTSGESDE